MTTQLLGGIPHDKRQASKGQHLYVVVIVTDGHDLLARDASMTSPALERMTLRAVAIQDVHDREVTQRILSAHNRDSIFQSA